MRIRVLKNHRFTLFAFLLTAGLLAFAAVRGLLPVVEANSGGGATMHALTLQFEGSGEVHLDPHDETFSSDTTRSYLEDTDVTMTATPDSGWYFDHWEGNVTGTGAVRTVGMSGPKIALAVFKQPTLVVLKEGSGHVQFYVQGSPPGDTLPPTSSRTYPAGTPVVLVATPAAGWGFKEWTIDAGGTSETKTIHMDEDKVVKAVFEPLKLTLQRQGEGQVSVSPPGITDEPTFTVEFTEATGGSEQVTIAALPAPGWSFEKWSGDHTGTVSPVVVSVDEDKTVTAHFKQIELTVNTEGRGLVQIDPPDITPLEEEYPHTETYPSSTQQSPQEVELTASPINAYWGFKEWTGNLGLDPETPTNTLTITVEMDEPRSVEAVFKQVELTIAIEGGGSVSTDPAGEVISEHVKGFAYANDVHLTAAADPGWAFKEWQGAVTGSALTASTDILLADATVTAVFEQIELTVDKQGNGVVNIDPPDITPGYGQYPYTETYGISTPENPVPVTLTATPAENWGFKEWQGDVDSPVDVSSKQIDMNAPKSVTAVFEQAVLTMDIEGEGVIETTPAGETLSSDTKGFRPGDPNVTDPISVEAVPGEEWGFKEWTGAINTQDNPALLEMDDDQSITAVFYQNTLTVNSTGQGQVSTGGDPQTPTFTEDFKPGKQVALTAHAEDGWFFKEWSGAVSGASTSVNVIMSEDRTVHALFERIELTVDTQGQGTVAITPPGVAPGLGNYPHTEAYPTNQGVALSANAAPGWCFKQWIGEVVPNGASATVTMNNAKTVTAVFELADASISSVTFTSDHNMLYDNDSNFEFDGNLIVEPEWVPSSSNWPIVHTMNTKVALELSIDMPDCVSGGFTVTGTGNSLTFLGSAVASGSQTVVALESNELLPAYIDIVEEGIAWTLTMNGAGGTTFDLGTTGPHKVFVTYGPNNCLNSDSPFPSESKATIKRMEFLCSEAAGNSREFLDPVIAAGQISAAIWAHHAPNGWAQVTGGLWKALDDGVFECEAGRHLGACGMLILGEDRSDIQQSYALACHAYPSTDESSGPGYNSDCTDAETRTDEFGLWDLILEGNGPVENFFKIRAPAGAWWYIAVAPFKGPVQGSGGTGNDADKAGRYGIMKDPPVYGQEWRLTVPPGTIEAAPQLP